MFLTHCFVRRLMTILLINVFAFSIAPAAEEIGRFIEVMPSGYAGEFRKVLPDLRYHFQVKGASPLNRIVAEGSSFVRVDAAYSRGTVQTIVDPGSETKLPRAIRLWRNGSFDLTTSEAQMQGVKNILFYYGAVSDSIYKVREKVSHTVPAPGGLKKLVLKGSLDDLEKAITELESHDVEFEGDYQTLFEAYHQFYGLWNISSKGDQTQLRIRWRLLTLMNAASSNSTAIDRGRYLAECALYLRKKYDLKVDQLSGQKMEDYNKEADVLKLFITNYADDIFHKVHIAESFRNTIQNFHYEPPLARDEMIAFSEAAHKLKEFIAKEAAERKGK